MKRRLFTLFISIAMVGTVLATDKKPIGPPDVTTKDLDLPPFHSIAVNSNYTVYLKQTNKQEVSVEALTEIYELSEFKVENGVLHINVERKEKEKKNQTLWAKLDNIKIAPAMNITISMRDIRQLHVNGGGKIIGQNSIASQQLDLAVRGAGSIDLDLKGRALTTDISGSGSITLVGYASSNNLSLAGSGSFNAFDCPLDKAEVTVTGSGNCAITVTDELNASIYGSGIVKHKGSTKSVKQKVLGPGTVERAY